VNANILSCRAVSSRCNASLAAAIAVRDFGTLGECYDKQHIKTRDTGVCLGNEHRYICNQPCACSQHAAIRPTRCSNASGRYLFPATGAVAATADRSQRSLRGHAARLTKSRSADVRRHVASTAGSGRAAAPRSMPIPSLRAGPMASPAHCILHVGYHARLPAEGRYRPRVDAVISRTCRVTRGCGSMGADEGPLGLPRRPFANP
jgi:hypothetical protein